MNFTILLSILGVILKKIKIYQLKKNENDLTVALSNKESSGNQQIHKNEAALNLFSDIVKYFKFTEENKETNKKSNKRYIAFILRP